MVALREASSWDQASCRSPGMWEVFFENEENLDQLHRARTICATCPVFGECLAVSTRDYPSVQYGIFAGYPPSTRKAVHAGQWEAVDWRADWDPADPVLHHLYPTAPVKTCRSHHAHRVETDEGLACAECGVRIKLLARR